MFCVNISTDIDLIQRNNTDGNKIINTGQNVTPASFRWTYIADKGAISYQFRQCRQLIKASPIHRRQMTGAPDVFVRKMFALKAFQSTNARLAEDRGELLLCRCKPGAALPKWVNNCNAVLAAGMAVTGSLKLHVSLCALSPSPLDLIVIEVRALGHPAEPTPPSR